MTDKPFTDDPATRALRAYRDARRLSSAELSELVPHRPPRRASARLVRRWLEGTQAVPPDVVAWLHTQPDAALSAVRGTESEQ